MSTAVTATSCSVSDVRIGRLVAYTRKALQLRSRAKVCPETAPYMIGKAPRVATPRTPSYLVDEGLRFASHGDDDFTSSVSHFQMLDGLGDLAQRVRPVDNRPELAGLHKLLQDIHLVVLVWH
jgi:hypothetical protein